MYNVLSKNGLLGLVSDQDAKKGIFVDFFESGQPKGLDFFMQTQSPILESALENFKNSNSFQSN